MEAKEGCKNFVLLATEILERKELEERRDGLKSGTVARNGWAIHQRGLVVVVAAYDNVQRRVFYQAMDELGFPKKLARLTMMQITQSRVMTKGQLSDPFSILNGLRREDPISLLLFNNVLQEVVQMADLEQILWHAYDLVVIGRTRRDVTTAMGRLEEERQPSSLQVNFSGMAEACTKKSPLRGFDDVTVSDDITTAFQLEVLRHCLREWRNLLPTNLKASLLHAYWIANKRVNGSRYTPLILPLAFSHLSEMRNRASDDKEPEQVRIYELQQE
ncbi:hypothetical protein AAG570_005472 [Ranatra chinensis]|uniref:Uncharacterized protein n=1 Tax=Ranatra chinensis TaxID=642074 RepID=A0ABD0XYJ9_9HEMI